MDFSKKDKEGNLDILISKINEILNSSKIKEFKVNSNIIYPLTRGLIYGIANPNDELFIKFKEVVHPYHYTPLELANIVKEAKNWQKDIKIQSVFIYALLQSEEVINSNIQDEKVVSEGWAASKVALNHAIKRIGQDISENLSNLGYFSFDPIYSNIKGFNLRKFKQNWHKFEEKTLASPFSLRHAAFAAGLGTFSLSDGFITDEGGIAHRLGAIITELPLPISERKHQNYLENCLYYYQDSKGCKKCLNACPANAIMEKIHPHEKNKCYKYIKDKMAKICYNIYKVNDYSCGKCQVNMPCTFKAPHS